MNCRLTPRVVIAALALLAASCSGERPVLLTEAGPVTTAAATTSSAVAQTTPAEVALAESDCVTASGSSWQLTIEPTPSPPVACLLVANHQRVEFVNNTTDAVSFDLAGLSVAIDPSSTFVTEPAGTFLQPGLTDLNATPHPISGLPALAAASPSAAAAEATAPAGPAAKNVVAAAATPPARTVRRLRCAWRMSSNGRLFVGLLGASSCATWVLL